MDRTRSNLEQVNKNRVAINLPPITQEELDNIRDKNDLSEAQEREVLRKLEGWNSGK